MEATPGISLISWHFKLSFLQKLKLILQLIATIPLLVVKSYIILISRLVLWERELHIQRG